ncbi:MAG: hypothetical protein U5L11_10500 [Arhodomonas sp.]|nr:hypothetical protein [Arhodomonas sp.]
MARCHPAVMPRAAGPSQCSSPLALLAVPAASLAGRGNAVRPCTSRAYGDRCSASISAYALLALSIDLVWGYAGILSLGHGAFFALGGYAMGMYLMRQIGTRGVYGDPVLPDFMVFLDWESLPWYWYGFDMFWFATLMVLLVPGLLAFVFGWLAFRSRVTGVYLSIISQAMTYALMLAFFRNEMGFGGNNGLTDFKDILGFSMQADGTAGPVRGVGCRSPAVTCRLLPWSSSSKLGRRDDAPCATPRAACASCGYRAGPLQARGLLTVSRRARRAWPARLTCPRLASSTRASLARQFHRGRGLGRRGRPRHTRRGR